MSKTKNRWAIGVIATVLTLSIANILLGIAQPNNFDAKAY